MDIIMDVLISFVFQPLPSGLLGGPFFCFWKSCASIGPLSLLPLRREATIRAGATRGNSLEALPEPLLCLSCESFQHVLLGVVIGPWACQLLFCESCFLSAMQIEYLQESKDGSGLGACSCSTCPSQTGRKCPALSGGIISSIMRGNMFLRYFEEGRMWQCCPWVSVTVLASGNARMACFSTSHIIIGACFKTEVQTSRVLRKHVATVLL
ncbi:hypothetical protein mRhiFer1_008093 [Rhinolophus ferrumequinum]|uniref:Uncharacterized protein n=1 Tax=Rhinolophus ferrumequinum TaxID=59479 RepID=A0A7J7WR57_RHIFE|nr:hypothetical protein mRhiFer1_008093 [Rhinolophus ferrumequinum]